MGGHLLELLQSLPLGEAHRLHQDVLELGAVFFLGADVAITRGKETAPKAPQHRGEGDSPPEGWKEIGKSPCDHQACSPAVDGGTRTLEAAEVEVEAFDHGEH